MYFIATGGKFRHLIIIHIEPRAGMRTNTQPVTAVGSTSSTPSTHPRSDRINIRSYLINKRKISLSSLFCSRRLNFLSSISNFDSFSIEVRLCQTRDICKRSSEPLFQLKINEYGWRNMKLDNSNSLFR